MHSKKYDKKGSMSEDLVKPLETQLYHLLITFENEVLCRAPAPESLRKTSFLREQVPDIAAKAFAYASEKGCTFDHRSPHIGSICLGFTNIRTEEGFGFFMYFSNDIRLHLYVSDDKTIMQKEYDSRSRKSSFEKYEHSLARPCLVDFIAHHETTNGITCPVRHMEFLL